MKNIILLALLGLTLASCDKTEEPNIICDTELHCQDEDCLFTLDNAEGTVSFLNCFGRWAIKVPFINDSNSWYIIDEWDAAYEEEGIKVTFCGYAKENALPLLFPDPMPGRFYQFKLVNIEVKSE